MKKKLNILLLSLFSLLVVLTPFVALEAQGNEEPEATKEQTIYLKWNENGKDKGFYNPEDKGKNVKMYLFVRFSGKDAEGAVQHDLYYKDAVLYEGKIGEEFSFKIPIDKITATDKKTYTDCEITGVSVAPDSRNHIYNLSVNLTDMEFVFSQSMNLNVKRKVAEGSSIRPEDEGKILVNFGVKEKGLEELVKTNASKDIEHTLKFREGQLSLWKYGVFKDSRVHNALRLFNPYTGKGKTFDLVAEFGGYYKENLAEKYSLEVTGNDLEGWNVELTSNFKVTFDSDNGSELQEQFVKPNAKLNEIEKPVKEGFDFQGWYTEAGDKFDFDTPITSDLNLKAKWDKTPVVEDNEDAEDERVLITFKPNEGKWADGTVTNKYKYVEKGTVIEILEAPIREGYEFDHWEGSKYQPGEKYTAMEDHTFTAVWKKAVDNTPETTEGTKATEATKPSETDKTTKPTEAKKDESKVTKTGQSEQLVFVGLVSLLAAGYVVRKRRENLN